MTTAREEFIREIGVKWIQAESGNTYLCPTAALSRISEPSEDDLKRICVDESNNPQND